MQVRLALLARSCRNRNARSSRFKNSLPILGAARAHQSSLRERASARQSPPASVLLDECGKSRRESLCSGRTDSIRDSEPDLWKLHLAADGDLSGGQRISLTLSLICAPSPCACVAVLTAERQAKNPLNIEHNFRNHPTLACISPHTMRTYPLLTRTEKAPDRIERL